MGRHGVYKASEKSIIIALFAIERGSGLGEVRRTEIEKMTKGRTKTVVGA